jgi:hypothetical protein
MKTLLLTLLIGIQGVAAYAADDKPEAGKSEIGRYQLIYGITRYGSLTTGTYSEEKNVWKIDTVTGQVWRFVSVERKGEFKESFVPVETHEP